MQMSDLAENLLSAEALDFVKEIESVCQKHGFSLTVSGDDNFQIWPLEDGMPSLYAPSIEEVNYVPHRD